jgi:hypothetical protein
LSPRNSLLTFSSDFFSFGIVFDLIFDILIEQKHIFFHFILPSLFEVYFLYFFNIIFLDFDVGLLRTFISFTFCFLLQAIGYHWWKFFHLLFFKFFFWIMRIWLILLRSWFLYFFLFQTLFFKFVNLMKNLEEFYVFGLF